MDKTRFSKNSPGRLIQITGQQPDWAFVPEPLPREWTPPPEMVQELVAAREALARLDAAARFIPDNAILIRPLQQREALKSSSLEGTFATPEELLKYGLAPTKPTSSRDRVSDWQEVFNYDRALTAGEARVKAADPISNRLVRELHGILMSGVRGSSRAPGDFRRTQVHIGSDRRFLPCPASEIPDLMTDLESFVNKEVKIDGLVKAFMAHYQFETIHPFLDGNGRIGRLLLSLHAYKWCNLLSPWLYLSAYFDRYKDEYIDKLFRVSTNGAWDDWIKFCLNATEQQANDSMRRIDKLIQIREYYDNIIAERGWPGRLHQLVYRLLGNPITDIPTLVDAFAISYPTAKSDVDKLIKIGLLKKQGKLGRRAWFAAREIFDTAYLDEPDSAEEQQPEDVEQKQESLPL